MICHVNPEVSDSINDIQLNRSFQRDSANYDRYRPAKSRFGRLPPVKSDASSDVSLLVKSVESVGIPPEGADKSPIHQASLIQRDLSCLTNLGFVEDCQAANHFILSKFAPLTICFYMGYIIRRVKRNRPSETFCFLRVHDSTNIVKLKTLMCLRHIYPFRGVTRKASTFCRAYHH